MTVPPTLGDLVRAIVAAAETFSREFLHRPASGVLFINGKEQTGMPIPVHKFMYEVKYQDDLGADVPENAPTTVEVVDLTGAPSTSATLTPDPSSDQKGTGEITADGAPAFKLRSTMGTIVLESDELDPIAGTPTTGVVIVTPA